MNEFICTCTAMDGRDIEAVLADIRGAGRESFISGVRNDITEATRCANKAGLKFDDPLTAVYHYRKHAAEFPQVMQEFGSGIAVHVGTVADEVFNEANLRETCSPPVGHSCPRY